MPQRAPSSIVTSPPVSFDDVAASADWSGCRRGNRWAVICGDAAANLRLIPAGLANCIVTSPPYFWLRDYGVHGQLGLEDTVDAYVTTLSAALAEARRVLRRDGLLFLNIGDTYYSGKGESQGVDRKSSKRRFGLRAVDKGGGLGIGLQRKSLIGIPWRVAIALSTSGWVLRCSIVWHRKSRLPEHVKDRPSRSYEYVYMFSKDRHYYFNKQPLLDQQVDEDMWTIAARPKTANGLDTASFPDELVDRCLRIGCIEGGLVLDPFLGAGTTIRVATNNGHSAIGIDLNREFCEYAVQMLASD